jgi:hypothetical protein
MTDDKPSADIDRIALRAATSLAVVRLQVARRSDTTNLRIIDEVIDLLERARQHSERSASDQEYAKDEERQERIRDAKEGFDD